MLTIRLLGGHVLEDVVCVGEIGSGPVFKKNGRFYLVRGSAIVSSEGGEEYGEELMRMLTKTIPENENILPDESNKTGFLGGSNPILARF